MKIFLLSAARTDLDWALSAGLVDGVFITPAKMSPGATIASISELVAELGRDTTLPISVTVPAVSAEEMYRAGLELARSSDNVMVQLPMVEEGLIATRRLAADGVRVGATLIFTAAQALLAAKAGASMVSIPTELLSQAGMSGVDTVCGISAVLHSYHLECDVFVTSMHDAADFSACMAAGADGAVLSTTLLRALMQHPLSDRGLDHLLQDLSKLHRARNDI